MVDEPLTTGRTLIGSYLSDTSEVLSEEVEAITNSTGSSIERCAGAFLGRGSVASISSSAAALGAEESMFDSGISGIEVY